MNRSVTEVSKTHAASTFFVWSIAAFSLAAFVYATFILEFFLGYPLDPVKSFLSEYAALDSPYRPLFAGADVTYSVGSIIGVGLVAATGWLRAHRSGAFVALAVVGAALFTLLDVAFPMQCAESLPYCPVSGVDMHLVMSVLVSTCHNVIALTMIWMWIKHRGSGHSMLTNPVLLVIAVAYVVCSVALSAGSITDPIVGIVQRVQVGIICLLIAALPWWWRAVSRTCG